MTLPLSAVKRFAHFPDGFIVRVKCRECRHERAIASDFFVRLLGPDAAPASLLPRLRCSKCGARNPISAIDGLPRN
jgi:ribosomal protein S27E